MLVNLQKIRVITGVILTLFISSAASAANVSTTDVMIDDLNFYHTAGNGDVVFTVTPTNASGCDGYWFDKSSGNYQIMVSALMSAYHAKNMLHIIADNASIWTGSTANFCEIYLIKYK